MSSVLMLHVADSESEKWLSKSARKYPEPAASTLRWHGNCSAPHVTVTSISFSASLNSEKRESIAAGVGPESTMLRSVARFLREPASVSGSSGLFPVDDAAGDDSMSGDRDRVTVPKLVIFTARSRCTAGLQVSVNVFDERRWPALRPP
jgi:hypothetical protein